jgi:hypothetical protein
LTKKSPPLHTLDAKSIQALSAIVARAQLAGQMGLQYSGDRDIYTALGYKTLLTYNDFLAFYSRMDIARAVIDRPVDATWRGGCELLESDDDNETALEKAWYEIYDRLSLHPKFSRLDKLTGIGSYGLLLLGLSDVRTTQDFGKPVTGGGLKLLWVKPFGEGSAPVGNITYVTDTSDERYGQPLLYQITVQNVSNGSNEVIKVHHSRVIHVADGLLESEIEGESRLQVVFNRLQDLEKIVGASAEMFWRGARPGYQGKLDKDFTMTQAMKDDLQDQVDEYEHNLRRMLFNEGVTFDSLSSQVADPTAHVLVQIQMISAVTGIPVRILLGSEVGELASTQDRNSWLEKISGRREEYAEPCIIRPFVDRCIKYGVLPAAKDEYSVKWQDLFSMGDKEKADIGNTRATALKSYATAGPSVESIVPPEAFFRYFLGLDEDQIELIGELQDAAMAEEEALAKELEKEAALLSPVPPVPPVPLDPNAPQPPVAPTPPGGPNGPTG